MPNTVASPFARGIHLRMGRLPFKLLSALLSSAILLTACGEGVSVGRNEPPVTRASASSVLAIGDSFLAWHRASRQSIPDVLEDSLGSEVTNRSVVGARFNYALPLTGAMGLNISKQYQPGGWDWVVVNGGGNDLWFGCGCIACDTTIDKLITPDAAEGKIPRLVSKIREGGTQVVFVGYLHSPSVFTIIDHCKDENIELEKRLSRLAEKDPGFRFLKSSGVVPDGDRSFHWIDMIHPSTKATKFIGERVAEIITGAITSSKTELQDTLRPEFR